MKCFKFFLALVIFSIGIVLCVAAASKQPRPMLPDKPHMTIKGTIYAAEKPVAGVVVSDGDAVATTDRDGCYWLPSAKRNGWVFVSIPSGYEVPTERSIPQFWATLEKPATEVERHDFELTKVDNDRHILLAVSDMHLSDQYNDLEQFCTTFLPRIEREVSNAGSIPVYTLNTGDMSFDIFWYACRYSIESYKKTLNIIHYPTPVFHAVGNHDNDGAVACGDSTDFVSVQRYCRALGPNYYSFNLGKVHYVVLDNIIYLNEPGGKKSEGIAGKRNYVRRVTPEQLAWLKKDLAHVTDKSNPVIVGMHAAAYHYEGVSNRVISWFSAPEYSEELTACFRDFTDVHYITGHTHANNTTYVNDHLIEHNIGAVCGSWWQPGAYFAQNLSPDGGPGGYAVFEIDGKQMKWDYRGIADGAEKQFRSYDMNTVRHRYRNSSELAEFVAHYPERDLRRVADNLVYINVWDWAPDWTISVTENGRPLEVVRERLEDPLYTLSFHLPKTRNGKYPESYRTSLQNHMFRVQASDSTSTLQIRITDRFGRIYTETMNRPKAFELQMR